MNLPIFLSKFGSFGCSAKTWSRDIKTQFVTSKSIFSSVSDAFDTVSELLDKQLFSNSKSDIVTNVFTGAIVKIVQRGQSYQQDDVTVGSSPLK